MPGVAQLHVHSNGMLGADGTGTLVWMSGRLLLLTHLGLRRNGMGAGGARQLAAALPLFPALADLDVIYNAIGAEGTRAMTPALAMCTVLARLDVSGNRVGVDGARSLAGVLRRCAVLTHLNLAENDVTELDRLGGGLAACASLTHVTLANNELSEDGVDVLVAVLACSRLQSLDLKNYVRSSSVARGLGLCTSLPELKKKKTTLPGRRRWSTRGRCWGAQR